MTLTASGSITLQQIATEFGGTLPKGMTDFYRSGTYVPPLTANASIPVSGSISMTNFYSGTVVTDMDASYYVESSGIKGGGSSASIFIQTSGALYGIASPTAVASITDTWVASSAAPGSWYEVYVSKTSGTTPNGGDVLNTWLSLSTDRSWVLTCGASALNCVLSLKVRHKYNTASEETTTFTLVANP